MIELVKQYVQLRDEIDDLEAALEELKQTAAQAEANLADEFGKAGLQSLNVDGHTVYLRRSLFSSVKAGQMDTLCAAMREIGAGDIAKNSIHAGQLSAWVREQVPEGKDLPVLPEQVKDLINVFEKFSISVLAS